MAPRRKRVRAVLTIKNIVVKNMQRITVLMVVIIMFLSTAVQIINTRQTVRRKASQIFDQVSQILEENSAALKVAQEEYRVKCLNNARTVAYILEYNAEARDSMVELKKIAEDVDVDEIHIFDASGVIVSGTHPEYWGFSFDSGEQMNFFKPLLTDRSLELVQDITPNTAQGKLVQYSALWSEDGAFIVQIGNYPYNVLRATEKNELSYIFSLLRAGVGYSLHAIDPETWKVAGSTVENNVDRNAAEMGFRAEQLASGNAFFAAADGDMSYCLSREIGENYVVWASPVLGFVRTILTNEAMLLAGLVLIALILVYAVSAAMDRTVVEQIRRVNQTLRDIQDGNLTTKVNVEESKEFCELSSHVNSMVASLLQSSERLELSEKIKSQKEELELQREQLEAALKRAEAASKAKSEFLFNMSHDIRTPMNAILGFTDLALESRDAEAQREYLKNIDISSKQLLDLINNILELSKIENHEIVIDEELVDVREICGRLRTIFDNDLKKKHQTLTVKLEVAHPYLYMDATHYSQIFLNIVGNSIKYTFDGGAIMVTLRETAGDTPGVCVLETVIEDNGIGMSDEFLAHAYESFSRERTSTISGIQGTGLGLAIVKNLVDLMKGTVQIKSWQGRGTRVIIRLPHRLGKAPTELPKGEKLDSALFQGRRVLLTEDIDINALIATKLLTGKGCLVERAKDGVECVDMLQKAEAGYYDLVLMDIQMPNMDGYRAAQVIRAFEDRKKASVPILALTANAFKEDCDKAMEAGMNGHVAKPLDAAKLFQAMAGILEEADGRSASGPGAADR